MNRHYFCHRLDQRGISYRPRVERHGGREFGGNSFISRARMFGSLLSWTGGEGVISNCSFLLLFQDCRMLNTNSDYTCEG